MKLEKGISGESKEKPPLFDRAAARRRVLDGLYGSAWEFQNKDQKASEDWECIDFGEGERLAYDPQKVRLEWVAPERAEHMQKQGWMIAAHHPQGGEEERDAVIAPVEVILDFPRIEGVEMQASTKGTPILKIGTLYAVLTSVQSLESYGLEGDEDRSVQIFIERITAEGRRGGPKGRQPEVAQYSFFKDARLLVSQLQAMGYERIIALPTDDLRSRAYLKLGFKETAKKEPISGTAYLVAGINELRFA